MDYKVAVLAYNFSHRKTKDILTILNSHNIKNVLVIAAPKVKLKHNSSKKLSLVKNQEFLHPRKLCKQFKFSYEVCEHDNFAKIKELTLREKSNLAIISGARIIKQNILDLFKYRVINYHPGALPETSGLDSFYWMIKKNIRPSVSAHFINRQVDSGDLIQELILKINPKFSVEDVKEALYSEQLNLHEMICKKIAKNERFISTAIFRPIKNNIMEEEEKERVLKEFNLWKKNYSVSN
jgi:folate-dependent phosphoribosylglycinamide formyltransferase PurN